jgi:hypothetical protein
MPVLFFLFLLTLFPPVQNPDVLVAAEGLAVLFVASANSVFSV